ncbi:MAG: EVE domain-containing protein [Candidatus Altiarchaeota archaeon]
MKEEVKNWLVIGVPKNWETALSQPVPLWGLKPHYQLEFKSMNVGDILWFYATSPIGGIIGIGVVKDKYVDNTNLVWEEELKQKEIIWPLRFRIHVLKVLPKHEWKMNRIKINDFNLFWQLGFQLLRSEHIVELFKRSKNVFGDINQATVFYGPTLVQPTLVREEQVLYAVSEEKEGIFTHKKLQEWIAEIGKLQFYYTEVEYPIELPSERKSIDVVWKREINGAPTFTFEIELSGMVEKAIERLKFAFARWNSRPRIIAQEELFKRINNLLFNTDKDFKKEIKIYSPQQILDLLNKKRAVRITEQNLKIY